MNNSNDNAEKDFDVKEFNKKFDNNKDELQKKNDDANKNLNLKFGSTNVENKDTPLKNFLINIKNSWFNVIDDVVNKDFKTALFTKDGRLFYIGITLLILMAIFFMFR